MEKESSEKFITTPPFRVAYPYLTEPDTLMGSGLYGVTMVFDKKTNISMIVDIIKEAVLAKWPTNNTHLHLPIKDGDGYPDSKELSGAWFMRAKNTCRPVGALGRDECFVLGKSDPFKQGCMATAIVSANAYSINGLSGVGLVLHEIREV